jgi:hypothetical protein
MNVARVAGRQRGVGVARVLRARAPRERRGSDHRPPTGMKVS